MIGRSLAPITMVLVLVLVLVIVTGGLEERAAGAEFGLEHDHDYEQEHETRARGAPPTLPGLSGQNFGAGFFEDRKELGKVFVAGAAVDLEIEFMRFAEFRFGGSHAAGDFVFVVLGAGAHPGDKTLVVDDDEDRGHVTRKQRVDAGGTAEAFDALDVDAHDEIFAAGERFEDAGFQRAVTAVVARRRVGVDPGPLEEFVVGHAAIEFGRREEVIVHAVDFARTRRARGCGDDARERGILGDEAVAERAFAGTSGAGEDEEDRRRIGVHCERVERRISR